MQVEKFTVGNKTYRFYSLKALEREGYDVGKLPYSVKVLLENVMRSLRGRWP
jgi:aconitate hydratase